jgi:predicted GIY-YIG superfamily endonuclease
MKLPEPKIRFQLANGLNEAEVKSAKFYIYAHECKSGMYIGVTNDPVKRWQEHFSNAFNEGYRDYDDDFRVAIRGWKHSFEHYILAIANFEKASKKKEAEAIRFYSPNLNMRNEISEGNNDYGYRPLKDQILSALILEKKSSNRQSDAISDKDRVSVVGLVYKDQGRKRLKPIDNQAFPEGMNISCCKKELDNFGFESKVRIKVSQTEREGKKFLKAANSASINLVD